MQPIGCPAPRSAAVLAPAIVAACDEHELCRAMGGASGRSSSSAPASFGVVTCNLLEFGLLCNLAVAWPAHFRGFACGRFRMRIPGPLPFSSMNSTPALSNARRTARSLAAVIDVLDSVSSARRIVVTSMTDITAPCGLCLMYENDPDTGQ
jgi:hypothetical protein